MRPPPRAWGAAAGSCWVVALLLALIPFNVPAGDGASLSCGRPVGAAFEADTDCAEKAQRRVSTIATLVILAGGTSTAYLAGLVKAGRDTGE